MDSRATTGVDTPAGADLDARCAQWIARMAEGDEHALGELYDATLGKVYGVAMRVVGDAALAEDVVAEAYHDVWRNAGRFDSKLGRPITWLLSICRNRALDEYRRRAADTRKIESAAQRGVAESVDTPEDLLTSVEERHVVHGLLAAISADDRQLLAMAFFKGLSHQQIADHTDMPLGTVKTRLRRALKKLSAGVPADLR